MKREDHKKLLNELLGFLPSDNQARGSEILTSLTNDYEQVLNTSEGFETANKELKDRVEHLRSVNYDLFEQLGTQKKEQNEDDKKDVNDGKKDKGENTLTFDKLFNDKGELI